MSHLEWSKSSSTSEWSNNPLTLKCVDVSLFLTILVAPFFMGGRQAFGQVVLCALACMTAIAWAVHQWTRPHSTWKFCGAEPFILGGIGIIAFQCYPISQDLLQQLSPKLTHLLPLWSAEHPVLLRAGTWNTITLAPGDTLSNLIVVIACVLTFFVGVQRIRSTADVRLLLNAVAFSGFAMAGFGIAQFLLGNGKFFWLYEHPFTDTTYVAKGAFTNANHFANFVAMTIPLQLCLMISKSDSKSGSRSSYGQGFSNSSELNISTLIWSCALAVSGIAVLLSMSRGGIVFSLLGVLITLFLFWRKSLLNAQVTIIVMSLAVACLTATLMFGDLAIKMVEQNFNELASTDINQLDQKNSRRKIWEANLEGIQEFPILGTGLGSHHEVYWLWYNHPHHGTEYTHAESGFLQVALETGLVGFSLMVLLWLLIASWCLRSLWRQKDPFLTAAAAAITAALSVNFAHSLTDFVWYAPACMVITLLLAACISQLSSRTLATSNTTEEAGSLFSFSRLSWGVVIPGVLALGVWMLDYKIAEAKAEPAWHKYITLEMNKDEEANLDGGTQETLERRRIELILTAAQHNPHQQRIQMQAGMACLKLFALQQQAVDNQMPLTQIKEAALSAFQDPKERNKWLNKPGVLGESRDYLDAARTYFRQALKQCPLQPQPYLQLAELVWLEGADPQSEQKLIEQAVLGRPYSAKAQFAMGRQYWLAGDQEQGIAHWQEAFRLDAQYRGHLITALSSYIPANFFLNNFKPDLDALRQLKVAYTDSSDRAGYRSVLQKLAVANARQALKAESLDAEKNWLEAHECFAELGNQKAAYHSAKEALVVNPTSYQAHLKLAIWTYDQKFYKEAYEHLTWCHRRKPEIEWLKTLAGRALIASGGSAQQGEIIPANFEPGPH